MLRTVLHSRCRQALVLAMAAVTAWVPRAVPAQDQQGAEPAMGDHICGSRWLHQERAAGRIAPMPMRDPRQAARASAPAQEPISVGTQLDFPVFGVIGTVSATCRFVGDRVFVFVENRDWDTDGGSIFQSHVDGLASLFEQSTPADPQRGIYDLSVEVFGEPPDVDGYPQIFLLITDLPHTGLIGLFDAGVSDHAIPELRRDLLYLDEFAVRRLGYLARGTLAHELQHLIHWNWDKDEEVWIDEGLSGYAEELVGFPEADPFAVPDFLGHSHTPLTSWPLVEVESRYYGATYLYASFLAERYGRPLISALVAEVRNGTAGVDAALEKIGSADDFEDTWASWVLANTTGGDLGNGYVALNGRRVNPFVVESLPLSDTPGFAAQWGTSTILFRTPGNLTVDFEGDPAGRYRVWSYSQRDGGSSLAEVELDAANQGRSLSAAIDSVVLVVGRTSIGGGSFEIDARRFTPTSVADLNQRADATVPVAMQLGRGFPNPFNSSVRVPFELSSGGDVELAIIDMLGRTIWRRQFSQLLAGKHEVDWDGTDLAGRTAATGPYHIRLRSATQMQSTPVLLLR
ncbi:MAG: hypothetical protein CME13_18395 [Gemmatimonadetes bacterium]|nr:hypothetical protein [Gemmatimonadota bacterium]HCV24923.1 hypothetical protein [Candidatus Latescibacterota bacterium]